MDGVQDALPLTQLEATLDTNAGSIGGRDCKIQRVSALQGYVLTLSNDFNAVKVFNPSLSNLNGKCCLYQ